MKPRNGLSAAQLQKIHDIYSPFSDAKIGVACLQENGCCIFANNTLAKSLDYEQHEIIGKTFFDVSPLEQVRGSEARLHALFKGSIGSYRIRRDLTRKDKRVISVSAIVSPIRDANQDVIAAFVIVTETNVDTTQLIELRKLSYAVENSGSAVLITDSVGSIEYVNQRFTEITGYELAEIIGKNPNLLRSKLTPTSTHEQLWSTIMQQKVWRGALVNKRKDGSHYWALQSISPICDQDGTLVNYVSVSDDISRLKEHEAQMEQLAFFDPLTSLGNRRKFRNELDNIIFEEKRAGVSALLLLDLDHFKQVNDTLGHDVGDELLISIANRLRFCSDEKSSVYRLGGDEFTLLIHNAKDLEFIKRLASDIIALLAQPIHIGQHEIIITISLGIAIIHQDGEVASNLLKNADLAMYEAKRSGRNRYTFFEPFMDLEIKRALSLELDLRHAIDNDQISLVYQPIIDLRSGKIISIEALSRWHHPLEGDIPPKDFLAKAEDTGLITILGLKVSTQACEDLAKVHHAGFDHVTLSLNMSARQLEDERTLPHLSKALEQTGISPQKITLEIIEGMVSKGTSSLHPLQKVKEYGIKLAIDDFGTGFSSLQLLKQMPVDTLKIDGSFIVDLPNNNDSAAIASTVVAMAEKMSLQITAESIETIEQTHFLIENNCFTGQGFLYCKPTSIDQLLALLANNQGIFAPQH